MSEGKAREFWIWTSDSGKKCKHIFDTKEAAFNRATKHSAMACGVSQLIRESEFESLKKENEALKAKLEKFKEIFDELMHSNGNPGDLDYAEFRITRELETVNEKD